jgi:peptide/nickel transport system permease protein
MFKTYIEQVRGLAAVIEPVATREDWMSRPAALEPLFAPGAVFLEWRTFGVPDDPITGFLLIDSILGLNWESFKDAMIYLIMPAFVLGINMTGILMRVTRSSMLETLSEDFIMTARAKGLDERSVIWRHGFRNALILVITVVGLEFGALLSGSIIVETIFSWPGIGNLLLQGLTARDYPLITGVVIVYTSLFVVVNLIVDICYAAADPRIRLAK